MRKAMMAAVAVAAAISGGCGGNYVLTVPDQVAPAGGEAVAVVRLQRQELFSYAPAIEGACIELRIDEGPNRGAYTDKLGYAGTTVPAPSEGGVYELIASHMDRTGVEAVQYVPAFVWPAEAKIAAVDYDCLHERLNNESSADVAAALQRLAGDHQIIYMTRRATRDHADIHARLERANCPEGPVLMWQRQFWHIVPAEHRYLPPKVVVETRLVSQLDELKKTFPNITLGVAGCGLTHKAFEAAGMQVVSIDDLIAR